MFPICATALLLLPALTEALSFSLDIFSDPIQCGEVRVDWEGATPPLSLTIIPALDYPYNISMGGAAAKGSYMWTVNYPSGTTFVAIMSDATGIGSGGVTDLYTVSGSPNSSACSLRPTATDFLFYLNETSVTQCEPVDIYWDASAASPVTILGAIPGGQAFQYEAIGSSTSLVWRTNVAAGTQFILGAFDTGSHGMGGSSSLLTVGGSSDSSCLDDSSPSSTPASHASTATSTSTKTSGNGGGGAVKTVTAIATAISPGAAGLSTATISGVVVGVVLLILILQAILFWFCCRRQIQTLLSHRRQMRERTLKGGDVDLLSTGGRADIDADISSASLVGPMPAGHPTRNSVLRPRVSPAGSSDGLLDATSVSPFLDPGASSPSGSRMTGPWAAILRDDDDDLTPPILGQYRHDSLGSVRSDGTWVTPQDSPSSSDSVSAFSIPTLPSQLPIASSSTQPLVGNMRKAQMAASGSSASGPASTPVAPGGGAYGGALPPQNAPPGGFRRHEDAGRVDEDVEDLPPMYAPEWEMDRRRGRGD